MNRHERRMFRLDCDEGRSEIGLVSAICTDFGDLWIDGPGRPSVVKAYRVAMDTLPKWATENRREVFRAIANAISHTI